MAGKGTKIILELQEEILTRSIEPIVKIFQIFLQKVFLTIFLKKNIYSNEQTFVHKQPKHTSLREAKRRSNP